MGRSSGQAHLAGHGLGQGLVRALALQPLGEAVSRGAGDRADLGRVAERQVVDGAGDRGFQQGEVFVGGLAGGYQDRFRLVAGHGVRSSRTRFSS